MPVPQHDWSVVASKNRPKNKRTTKSVIHGFVILVPALDTHLWALRVVMRIQGRTQDFVLEGCTSKKNPVWVLSPPGFAGKIPSPNGMPPPLLRIYAGSGITIS